MSVVIDSDLLGKRSSSSAMCRLEWARKNIHRRREVHGLWAPSERKLTRSCENALQADQREHPEQFITGKMI
jgi:hypothetical protein